MNSLKWPFITASFVVACFITAAAFTWANRLATSPSLPPLLPSMTSIHEEEGPLRGHSPTYTAIALPICTDHLLTCNQWEYCGEGAAPRMTMPKKLWDVHVVGGKDGPVLVCEWR